MDGMDTEMMDTAAMAAAAAANGCCTGAAAGVDRRCSNDDVRDLLDLARQLAHQGNPSQALHAVMMAMKAKGGKDAVFEALHRARELYRQKLQASAAAEQLASLFAECAIAEAQPVRSEEPAPCDMASPLVATDVHESSILAETGREQVVLDAFSDGSSFICLQCGGLVSSHRKDEHYAYWCCQV